MEEKKSLKYFHFLWAAYGLLLIIIGIDIFNEIENNKNLFEIISRAFEMFSVATLAFIALLYLVRVKESS